jgi:hypothetical protein
MVSIRTLREFRRENEGEFIEFCERTGRKEVALRYYAKSTSPETLLHAAKLAYELKRYRQAKNLLGKARAIPIYAPIEHNGSWGDAYAYIGYENTKKTVASKVAELEALLNGK